MLDVTAKVQVEEAVTLVPTCLLVRLDGSGGQVMFAPQGGDPNAFVDSATSQLPHDVAQRILQHPDVQAEIVALKQRQDPSVKISSDIPKKVKDAATQLVAAMVAAEAALAEEVTP